ncbi:MAG: hypothetical protein H0S79_27370 [Anaerolineaceae bacterium]|nr:hypothetical protein [Anaerolineaceae bacterium]
MTNSTDPRDPTQLVHQRRPFPIRLIFWMLILWTILGWLRFSQAWQSRALVEAYTSTGVWVYMVSAGLVWGLIGLPALWGLMRRTSWARLVIAIDAALYPALYWMERLFLWQDENSQGNWAFMLALTLLWLGMASWGMLGKKGRAYFPEKKA